ncbi:MAG: phenylalanine--tRNA ligase subunit beta [Desulfobulbaceae bacterium]|uniref:Phenylalanine--tRNA ligase beta subunit n=1 Tax=Candidatus Desulfatifera sulfidica TaxID=2841691 RepID=A0A8J6NBN8_9BACT|nr:phenylalanine--tRNA ligase subunit beta [Candidatus Desulfatifera sulfidica]
MKVTLDWLNEYVNTDGISPQEIADHLTMLGLEVDSVEELFQELAPLKTALIVTAEPHPDADKLTLCQVSVGDETHQIVCGAPNARAGLVTCVALPGTILPDGLKIKKSKIRGVKSNGMLCSERELGLSQDHTGIMELPAGTDHGLGLLEALDLNDILIEVDLTPNRPDCTSVIGVAREVSGISRRKLSRPVEEATLGGRDQRFSVDVESSELCPRYSARLITNVTIGPSPWWLRKRLLSVGIRPINNVVDITNYVMMEYGQPMHAFDFQNLAGGAILVRQPRNQETTFTTLDNIERPLEPSTLLICDRDKPVALAGIMGGLNSEVSEATTEVLLESACFDPVSVRKTARRLKLATEASYRFERGVDPGGCVVAMERAVQLLCELSGGTAEDMGRDAYSGVRPLNSLTLRISRTSNLLGMPFDYEKISELLQSIGIRTKPKDDDTLWVNPPTFRVDLEREVDLIEEVARLVGYNTIPTTLPMVHMSYPEQDKNRRLRSQAQDLLTAISFSEAINYSFTSTDHPQKMELAEGDARHEQVTLLNPLSEEQAVMRTMLLPGLLENVQRNISFQKTAVKLFEIGKVFTPTGADQQPVETTFLAGVLSGNRHGASSSLHHKPVPVDIFDAKGAVEYLLQGMRLRSNSIDTAISFQIPATDHSETYTEPGQCLIIHDKDEIIGSLGKINPVIARKFGVKQDVYYFDINFDRLCAEPASEKSFNSLPVYPAVKRDIALVIPDHVPAGELLAAIRETKEQLIENCAIFDVYQGKNIEDGHKSVALSVTYRSPKKTLTEKVVEKSHSKIVKMLASRFEGSLRQG